MELSKIMFALLRFELNETALCDDVKKSITAEMYPALFKLSKRQDLAHLIGDALDRNGLLSDGTVEKKLFLQERNMAVYRYEQMHYEYERICETLKNKNILFIPLKGAVLRQYYPEPWMRTSCDIDILIEKDRLEEVENILTEILKYRKDGIGAHDVHFYSEGGIHLELHFSLIELQKFQQQKNAKLILDTVWNEIKATENSLCILKGEFFFFYHLVHMFDHFIGGGCGVRFFLDTWIIRRFINVDDIRFNEFLKNADLFKFADGIIQTTNAWFDNGQETSIVIDIQEYVLYAGMYGDIKNRMAIEQGRKGNKISYILKRIFLPYEELKYQYPIIKKHKILTPICQLMRWGRLVFNKHKSKPLQELQLNSKISKEERNRAARIFVDLGIY